MKTGRSLGVAGLAALGGYLCGYLFFVRPWFLRWGATKTEVLQNLPGDDLVKQPRSTSTRAITIHAPVSAVWPWLLQIGQDRGSFSCSDRLEPLAEINMQSADQILPPFQRLEVGEYVRLVPEQPFDFVLEVREMKPNQAMILCVAGDPFENREAGLPNASWAFVLHPLDEEHTRLIIRWRADYKPTIMNVLWNQILLEPVHFLMEQKMLRGIKQQVEQAPAQKQATPV